ncbi:MAG: flagellar protein FlgN [Parafilimonas terrae]|nr:flagellar protein FlgN [Parafilimonas terrae]
MTFSLRAGSRPAAKPVPPEEPVDPGTASALAAFMAVVGRIEGVVEAETEALSRNLQVDMVALNHRKRQGLLELSRVMRTLTGFGPNALAQARLGGLAAKLDANRIVLDRQLRAMREVTEIVARSLRDADSDGTYSRLAGRG